VVGDRFQAAKLYRAALDDLRKNEMKELKRILNKREYVGLKGIAEEARGLGTGRAGGA
jgi:hypothetical protein